MHPTYILDFVYFILHLVSCSVNSWDCVGVPSSYINVSVVQCSRHI